MNLLQRQLENPVRFKRLKRWFYGGLAALAIAEVATPRLFPAEQGHFWFEDLPAWGSVYGFISCVAIIAVSKFLGHIWLSRREDYYDS